MTNVELFSLRCDEEFTNFELKTFKIQTFIIAKRQLNIHNS